MKISRVFYRARQPNFGREFYRLPVSEFNTTSAKDSGVFLLVGATEKSGKILRETGVGFLAAANRNFWENFGKILLERTTQIFEKILRIFCCRAQQKKLEKFWEDPIASADTKSRENSGRFLLAASVEKTRKVLGILCWWEQHNSARKLVGALS